MNKCQGSEASLASMVSMDRSVRINMEPDRMSEYSSSTYKKRGSIAPIIVQEHLQRIKSIHGVESIARETKHFCETTTMHGPKRIYGGKRWARALWLLVYLGSFAFLIAQIGILITDYLENPTNSQVSFYVDEEGIYFPAITICNFNPIKASNIEIMNRTGDFHYELLDYMMESNMDASALFSSADMDELTIGDNFLKAYQQNHPSFDAQEFFMDAGFNCSDIMMTCTFGGRQFDCCQYSTAVLTNMGKCYKMNLQNGPEWMKKQISAGVDNGLQLILDARGDEILSKEADSGNSFFSTSFETGFRFFVHHYDRDPNPAIEGISVSPNSRVYTALSINEYHLLSEEHYGNCTNKWPIEFQSSLPYTTMNCETFCRAQYFNQTCGCSPAVYNIDDSFKECTPLETVTCMHERMKRPENGSENLGFPLCTECKVECSSVLYNAFNSYGHEFNPGSLKWLSRHSNYHRSVEHIKENFLTVNVFFRDLTHVEYTQTKASSVTQLLSNIGGNMGLFLGMSLITIAEALMYLTKIAWIAISRRRREYLYRKKQTEKEDGKVIKETVRSIKLSRKNKIAPAEEMTVSMEDLKAKIRGISTVGILVTDYLSKSTTSQVSFYVNEEGIHFPAITICNFNPIKASNIEVINRTGDFRYDLLDYLMESNIDAVALFSSSNMDELQAGDNLLKAYQQAHPNFNAQEFFMNAGFNCTDIMMTCTFGGRQFDCCQYSSPVITNMGKCYKINLQNGPEWMKKQTSAGVHNGLQLILDARGDEILSKEEDANNSFFSTSFETGFRFHVHHYDRDPNPAIEGISVSPSSRVYTALSVNEYHLLSEEHSGNCTNKWPIEFQSSLLYTTMNCETFCRAQYFNQTCGCSPAPYNIDNTFKECTPLETVTCMHEWMKQEENGTISLKFPLCTECKVECSSILYNAFNSYGHEFNPGSLKWLSRHSNYNRSVKHIKENFLTVNLFFRDLTHVEHTQTKSTSITELLSNIGGNMGLFLGMSLITIAEGLMYLTKIAWIAISRKRREYLYTKKVTEKEDGKVIQETVRSIQQFRKNRITPMQDISPIEGEKRWQSSDQDQSGIYPI